MLTEHETRHEHATRPEPDAQMKLPALDEPALEEPAWEEPWLEEDIDEEMAARADSPLRGMWIGIAAAAVTFVLVFAIPQWLGWYDVGTPPQARREASPESIISTVTAQPSGAGAGETGPPPATAAAAAPAPASPPSRAAKATVAKETRSTEARTTEARTTEARTTEAKSTEPKSKPPAAAAAPSSDSGRRFSIQIAAFKTAKPAGALAAKVKRSGYPADVRRVESAKVPWVVRVGSYASREQAESAREALARKGFPGFIL
jgi:cell division septation protein DedD